MSKAPSSRHMLAGVLAASIASVWPAEQARPHSRDRNTDAHHDRETADGRDDIPAGELGYRFLSTQEALQGQLGNVYEMLKQLREGGHTPDFSLSYFMRYPDGTEGLVRLESFAELEHLITEIKRDHDIYAALVQSRTSRSLKSAYTVVVSPTCPQEGFSAGYLDVQPNDLVYTLRQERKTFEAVTVDATVTVVFPGGLLSPLAGTFDSEDVELADATSSCRVRLIHREHSD